MKVEWRNPKYANHEQTRMDIEVNHPRHGWIPFTLDPTDKGAQLDTAELFQEVLESNVVVTDYDGPSGIERWRSTTKLSWNAFLRACLGAGIITSEEIPIAASNQLPESVKTKMINAGMTQAQQDEIAVTWALTEIVKRDDKIVFILAGLYGLDEQALDALFGYDGDKK